MEIKILLLNAAPPKSYLKALSRFSIKADCRFGNIDTDGYKGLLLTGGGDVFPAFYGGKGAENVNLFRDAAEFNTLSKFVEKKLPVLGICRGMQIINVFFGGTLKNVPYHYSPSGDVYHTLIASDFYKGLEVVNSSHRQAADSLPEGFFKAKAFDGTIEAIRKDNVQGVQFHPERMDDRVSDLVYGEFYSELLKVR